MNIYVDYSPDGDVGEEGAGQEEQHDRANLHDRVHNRYRKANVSVVLMVMGWY